MYPKYFSQNILELIKNKTIQEQQKLRNEIVKRQLKFYSSSEVSLEEYKNFLNKF